MDYLIGTGGWAYFPSHNKPRLKAYSKVFNFVEVNATFYENPDIKKVEYWRNVVPKDFVFSVRCHQDITHRLGLRSTNETFELIGRDIAYCRVLNSPFLVLETPSTFVFRDETVDSVRDFLSSVNLHGVSVVWENRSPLTTRALRMMQDLSIVHSVDLSQETPLAPSDLIYTRLFGKGKHNIYQFTDEELEEIDHKILTSNTKKVVLSYHGVRMFTDALRFANYKQSGTFPSITPFIGAESAKQVLLEDARFPVTKNGLLKNQGWKLFDATEQKRLRLSDWLYRIPEKTYNNINEVVAALEVLNQYG